ncbi:MAG TPA: hypothetical protein DCS67_07450 [Clostridiales bacterium UBA8960]|jgi:uncharacterized membrane protein (UPF0127 family)|nr:hypothetical protein [Clostridiales bacterium UBA8960]
MKIIKVDTIKQADTFLKRLIGYMFQNRPTDREIMIFNNCDSIHTFNMKFNIDVLFLDEENRVIKKFLSLPKGRFLPPVKGASRVIEAPEGLFIQVDENEIVSFD